MDRSLSSWHRNAPPLSFSRQPAIPAARREAVASWDNLAGKDLVRRADRVMAFSRSMSGDVSDTFHTAEQLDSLLGGADPSTVDNAVAEARQSIHDGGLSMDRGVEWLMSQFGKNASSNNAPRLAALFRRTLASDKPIGKAFAEMEQADGEISPQEQQAFRYAREASAIQFARETGRQLPPEDFCGHAEATKAGILMSQRKGLTFDRAIELIRTGK